MLHLRVQISVLVTVATVAVAAGPPAEALPKPREEEWWFGAWGVETKLWPVSTGEGVTVAVIDSGVNARLPELRGVVLPGKSWAVKSRDGRQDVDAERGHGTAMAALIAGQGRGTGTVGVAPGAKILPLVAIGTGLFGADAIRWAADHGAKVISISQGTHSEDPCPSHLQQAIAHAIGRNVVVVAGAGNEGDPRVPGFSNRPVQPAACAGVLAVGAVDGSKKVWKKSSPGGYISVAAPGVQVGAVRSDGTFKTGSGTSQATALTSGVVALIRAKYPKMPARQVVQRITATASDVGPPGRDDRSGHGAVIPYRALNEEVSTKSPNPTFERFDQWTNSQQMPTSTTQAKSAADEQMVSQGKGSLSNSSAWVAGLALSGLAAILIVGIYWLRRFSKRSV